MQYLFSIILLTIQLISTASAQLRWTNLEPLKMGCKTIQTTYEVTYKVAWQTVVCTIYHVRALEVSL